MQPFLLNKDEIREESEKHYLRLLDYCSGGENDLFLAAANLEAEGPLRLAARFGLHEFINMEVRARQAELTRTMSRSMGIAIPIPKPLIEAITGPEIAMFKFDAVNTHDRGHCIQDLLELCPEAANLADPDGISPLGWTAILINDGYTRSVLPHVKDVNAGLRTRLY